MFGEQTGDRRSHRSAAADHSSHVDSGTLTSTDAPSALRLIIVLIGQFVARLAPIR